MPLGEMQSKPVQLLAKTGIAASIQQMAPACLQQKPNTIPLPSSKPMQDVVTPLESQLQGEGNAIANHNAPLLPKKHVTPTLSNAIAPKPPDFQSAMDHLPPRLPTAFKDLLHGEVVGIWPIRDDRLR